MKRSYLENIFQKTRQSFKEHTKGKSIFVVDYINKTEISNNLYPKFVSDNKLFWKTGKPLFF